MKISYYFKDAKPFTRLLGLFLIYLACVFIATPLSHVPDIFKPAAEDVSIRLELVVDAIVQVVVFAVPAVLFSLLFFESPRQQLGLRMQGRLWLLGLVGMVITILLVPLGDWLSLWNGSWNLGPLESSMRDMTQKLSQETFRLLSLTSGGDLALQIVVVAMVPAICEELFFRGALQPVMQTLVRNEHVGVLLTAVIFSLLHGDIYGFIPRLVLGAFLGYLFWTTGSLVAGMCAHFANNLIVVVLNHLYNAGTISFNPLEPMGMSWVMTVGCTLGAILLFYIYFVKNLSNNNVQTPSES